MRILVIHQYYLRPGEPGGSRFNSFAWRWAEQGHNVFVVAGSVNYSTGTNSNVQCSRFLSKEQDGAVTVRRCYTPRSYSRSYKGRTWAFLIFCMVAVIAALRCPRPDVVIATSPPLVTVFPGWIAARCHGARFVFEVRDLLPESAVTTGVLREGAGMTKLLSWLERFACRSADMINVLTPAFMGNMLGRGLAPQDKFTIVPNGADLERFVPGPPDLELRRALSWDSRFVALYAGDHGKAHAVGQLIEAAQHLTDRPDILIACVGDGTERQQLEDKAAALGLRNIVFHGPRSKENMPDFVRSCDVGVAVLQDNPTFRTVYPNKIFDYMACGKPMLLAIDGVARELVCGEAMAGIFAAPEDGRALAAAIRAMADDPQGIREMGERGLSWVTANADINTLAASYLSHLKDLVYS